MRYGHRTSRYSGVSVGPVGAAMIFAMEGIILMVAVAVLIIGAAVIAVVLLIGWGISKYQEHKAKDRSEAARIP